MKFNAHKNLGEVLERINMFMDAKSHYTRALKISDKDSFIWSRLGFLEYEKLHNLDLARQCFEAATQTISIIEKRGTRICPILVKLAEINILTFNFKKSEEIIDIILSRIGQTVGLNDKSWAVFAYLMKGYFLSLRGEEREST